MSIYQIGLLHITLVFYILIVSEIANPEKSINWIKWYYFSIKRKGKITLK